MNERKEALNEAYKRIISSQGINSTYMKRELVISLLTEVAAPRFYLKPYQAQILIRKYYKNDCKPTCSNELKNKMVEDLVEQYEKLRNEFPHLPKNQIWEKVVKQPAKSFYMTPHRIEEVIFNYTGRNSK